MDSKCSDTATLMDLFIRALNENSTQVTARFTFSTAEAAKMQDTLSTVRAAFNISLTEFLDLPLYSAGLRYAYSSISSLSAVQSSEILASELFYQKLPLNTYAPVFNTTLDTIKALTPTQIFQNYQEQTDSTFSTMHNLTPAQLTQIQSATIAQLETTYGITANSISIEALVQFRSNKEPLIWMFYQSGTIGYTALNSRTLYDMAEVLHQQPKSVIDQIYNLTSAQKSTMQTEIWKVLNSFHFLNWYMRIHLAPTLKHKERSRC
jgi:hypothetical protein